MIMTSPDKQQQSVETTSSNHEWHSHQQQQQQQEHHQVQPQQWQPSSLQPQKSVTPNPSSSPVPPPPPPGFQSDHSEAVSDPSSRVLQQQQQQRTSSFVNLAAVLGTGLAESMDDATTQHQLHHPPQGSVDVRDSSFARQSRHAAARLIGASPPRGVVEPLGLGYAAATATASSSTGAPPATLRNTHTSGGVGANHNSHGSGTAHTTAAGDGMHGNYLSAAFAHSTVPADDGPEELFGTPGRPSKDLGVTVTEPGSEQRPHNHNSNSNSHSHIHNHIHNVGGETDDGLFEALLREQQQQISYCTDPTCKQQQPQQQQQRMVDGPTTSTGTTTAGRRISDGVLASLMQMQQQDPQSQQPFYCNDPQCQQQLDVPTGVIEQRPPLPPLAAVGVAGRRTSEGVLASLMQQQPPQDQQIYCDDPQCQQQQSQQQHQHQQHSDGDTFEAERGLRNLWLNDDAASGSAGGGHLKSGLQQQQQYQHHHYPTDRSIGASSGRSEGSQSTRQVSETDIRPFIWDTQVPQQPQQRGQQQYQQRQPPPPNTVEPSRCLAILRTADLHVPDVRSTCEAFGVLESFRSDFADRGIIFVSYYDIRSAQYAAQELEAMLKRRESIRDGGSAGQDIAVYYCVPLNSSSQTDDSRLVLADIPPFVNEHSLLQMLSSYGAVRSLRRQGGNYGGSSYEAEFHNVQDSKQALLELSSTQPWGPDVAVEVGMRPPIDRKRGRELLSVIGRWRHGGSKSNISPASSTGARGFDAPSRLNHGAPIFRGTESSASSSSAAAAPPETQLVMGPDGRYSYMVVNNQSGFPQRRPRQDHLVDHNQRQQIVHGPNGEIYLTTALPPHQPPPTFRHGGPPQQPRDYWSQTPAQPAQHPHHLAYSNAPYHVVDSRERLDRISGPYYSQQVIPSHPDHHGMHHHPHPHSSNASSASVGGDDKDNKHLVLDLDSVENGRDHRTSLMVRNIPNKYTQQMLLSEFTENGLGPGVIDFFYLPIDFKNRCNRGYAFINFVDFKDILPFHQRYFGKHWSTFNSDKICDITYARIQGKAAMLKRFENSALMEKDEEYKPLVFISHGPEKGKRIPFPEAAAAANKS